MPTLPVQLVQGAAIQVDERDQRLLAILRRAVARACPGELAGQREDLVQAAAVRLLERESRGEPNQLRSASYLWRVAFTTVLDELRRSRRRKAVISVSESEVDAGERAEAPRSRPELVLGIRDCLEALAPDRRSAVVLYLQGFGPEEAGRTLRWDAKRVKNLIYRGLADLRACLESKGVAP